MFQLPPSIRAVQQLQQQIDELKSAQRAQRAQQTHLQNQIDELALGWPQLVEDRRQYRKMLRRNIAARARDRISQEGAQPPDVSFYRFSTQLAPAFLRERKLTERAILFLNGSSTLRDGARPSRLGELQRGLEGLSGDKLETLTLLYNFVVSASVDTM
jgi:hypothetical protein